MQNNQHREVPPRQVTIAAAMIAIAALTSATPASADYAVAVRGSRMASAGRVKGVRRIRLLARMPRASGLIPRGKHLVPRSHEIDHFAPNIHLAIPGLKRSAGEPGIK